MKIFLEKLGIILVIFCVLSGVALGKDINVINFEGSKYHLIYSSKSEENNGYLNEYFKEGEGMNTWTEMIAVHHFPNMFSPLDQAESFREYLDEMNCPSAITLDEKNNTGIIDFVLIDGKKLPIILEFNVFKYEKSPECGTIGIQYAKRYSVSNSFDIEAVKKEFAKQRKKTLKNISRIKIPQIVNSPIDKSSV